MNKQYNYIDCIRCTYWSIDTRREFLCNYCNNSLKVIDPKEILCNLCGGPMRYLGTEGEYYPCGLENAVVRGQYDSYHMLDDNVYKFSFCEECLRKLFNQCKIKPDLSGSDVPMTWEEDQKYYEYRVWEDTGGHHQAYLNKKCNRIKDCPNVALYTLLYDKEFSEDCTCEEHKDLYCISSTLTKFIPDVLKAFL
jgi:hypothetical protein